MPKLTEHPFVSTPNSNKCSSCGKTQKHSIHTVLDLVCVFIPDFAIPEPVLKPTTPIPQPKIFTPVERELIMADIAYLKQREHDDGSWDKWKQAQKRLGVRFDDNKPDEITRERYFLATGCEPQRDDLDRCNCSELGRVGHRSCGWCVKCEKPVFMCGHIIRRT